MLPLHHDELLNFLARDPNAFIYSDDDSFFEQGYAKQDRDVVAGEVEQERTRGIGDGGVDEASPTKGGRRAQWAAKTRFSPGWAWAIDDKRTKVAMRMKMKSASPALTSSWGTHRPFLPYSLADDAANYAEKVEKLDGGDSIGVDDCVGGFCGCGGFFALRGRGVGA